MGSPIGRTAEPGLQHQVPVADHVRGTDTLLSIEKAECLLGYLPDFTWRELL
jgi:hypothetical protein